MKNKYWLLFLVFPTIIFSQNLDSQLMKIDSIVRHINDTDDELSEGIVEGPIIYKGWFKKMEVGVLIIFAISKNLMNP